MRHVFPTLVSLLGLLAVSACAPTYRADTYATRAVQQANPADRGVIIGVRPVRISADGSTGGATGAAAGGLVGSQTPGGGLGSAFGALGGAVFGGLVGTAVERAAGDMEAIEYIIRKPDQKLVAVTQRDETPLPVGTHVLVIAGSQARVVIDYTEQDTPPAAAEPVPVPAPAPAQATSGEPALGIAPTPSVTAAPLASETSAPPQAAAPSASLPDIRGYAAEPPLPAAPPQVTPPPQP
ncbi:outer membrane lipoprotein SlyB [Humitalea rosea]|uniref:Outer membrane lipoprotein SlyB n=1 Tax=Humitalea rosea TaxID=990373 RepID=A0A2W7IIB3_9PROT|nr:hypothetical protein [Humitalea rosea]PZW46615.1 outer membrane lipoprotein SlyB [Humitalea rosea]